MGTKVLPSLRAVKLLLDGLSWWDPGRGRILDTLRRAVAEQAAPGGRHAGDTRLLVCEDSRARCHHLQTTDPCHRRRPPPEPAGPESPVPKQLWPWPALRRLSPSAWVAGCRPWSWEPMVANRAPISFSMHGSSPDPWPFIRFSPSHVLIGRKNVTLRIHRVPTWRPVALRVTFSRARRPAFLKLRSYTREHGS